MPTTVASASSASAAVRISAAEAVLRSIRTTSGTLGSVVADGLVDGVALGAGVGGDDDFVLGQEDAGAQHRLLEQAAAVAAQVEHDPFRALLLDLFDPFAQRPRGRLR